MSKDVKKAEAPATKIEVPAVKEEAKVPAPIDLYEGDESGGFGNVSTEDMAIPFIVILQSGSPQVKRGDAQIPGAKEGDIYNTITGELFEELLVIPCAFQKAYVEWRPRDSGGGFVAQHKDASILNQVRAIDDKNVLPNGNIVVVTAYHYVLVINRETGDYSQAVISMTSTQLKKSRKWLSLMMGLKMTAKDGHKFTPPMWAYTYAISTVAESNDKGAWSGFHIEKDEMVTDTELYMAAKDFAQAVNLGAVSVKAPPSTDTEEEVPF